MPYLQRDPVRNTIVGAFEQKQDFAREYVAPDNPEYLAFIETAAAPKNSLEQRVDALTTALNLVISRIDRIEK